MPGDSKIVFLPWGDVTESVQLRMDPGQPGIILGFSLN